ncbi:MAG: hypothetical protein ACQERZ_03005 [Fusobacteriota bacterium]
MKADEKGVVLISIIFFMVILILIGIGISTISNRGLEDSAITRDVFKHEELSDGLMNIEVEDINNENYSKSELHMIINDKPKNFNFEVNNDLHESIIVITSREDGADWELDYLKKQDNTAVSLNETTESAIGYREYEILEDLIQGEKYKIKVKDGSGEYIIYIKGFYD